MLGFGKYHIIYLSGINVRYIRRTQPWYTKSLQGVCWGSVSVALEDLLWVGGKNHDRSGIVAFDGFMVFMPFPIVYTVGGWRTKPGHIGIPDTRPGYQLNVVLHGKNQELREYAGVLVNIPLCVNLAYMSDMLDIVNRDTSRVHRVCVGDLEVSH